MSKNISLQARGNEHEQLDKIKRSTGLMSNSEALRYALARTVVELEKDRR